MRCSPRAPIRATLLAVSQLSLLSCAGYRSPAISVIEVVVTESSEEALALGFVVELENPNADPLYLDEFSYVLAIDDRLVYAGRRAAGATLSAAGTRRLTLPAIVPYERMGWVSAAPPGQVGYALTGTLRYNAPGDIARLLFNTGLRRPKAAWADRGQIRLAQPR